MKTKRNPLLLILFLGALGAAWIVTRGSSDAFLQSYLFAWLFWLGLALGAQAVLLMHRLTAGQWGIVLGPPLKATAATLLPLLILALPLLLGFRSLYPWAQPGALEQSHELHAKAAYLAPGFFLLRSVIYLVIWFALSRWSRALGAGLALVLYFVSVSFAVIDWVMTLEPEWNSSVYGLLFVISQALGALAVAVIFAMRNAPPATLSPPLRRDLANLLLAGVLVWTYLNFMQYLIIWSGNLPREVAWILSRTESGWLWVVVALGVLQFALPFFLLLFRPIKERSGPLAAIAGLILIMQAVDTYWKIVPAFHRTGAFGLLPDLLCFAGIGALWLWRYRGGAYAEA